MYLPSPITIVDFLYWESIERRGWANTYTYDLLEFFQYRLPNGIRPNQHFEFNTYNSHVEIEYSDYTRRFIEGFMRPYKLRRYPLIMVNRVKPGIVIDSAYAFDEFTEQFAEAINTQLYGKREEPVSKKEPEPTVVVEKTSPKVEDLQKKKKSGWFW